MWVYLVPEVKSNASVWKILETDLDMTINNLKLIFSWFKVKMSYPQW